MVVYYVRVICDWPVIDIKIANLADWYWNLWRIFRQSIADSKGEICKGIYVGA